MRVHKTFTYVEDRDFYVDYETSDLHEYMEETSQAADLSDPDFLSGFYEWLVESGLEEQTNDYDSWYGNPMGEETNINYKIG